MWCGHEYTVKNMQFAVTVDERNPDVHQKLIWAEVSSVQWRRDMCMNAQNMREGHGMTVPSTIGAEKTFNPFMRVE